MEVLSQEGQKKEEQEKKTGDVEERRRVEEVKREGKGEEKEGIGRRAHRGLRGRRVKETTNQPRPDLQVRLKRKLCGCRSCLLPQTLVVYPLHKDQLNV